jgi:hypothetical protein
MCRGRARHAGYPLQSPAAPSFLLPRGAVCRVIVIVLCRDYYYTLANGRGGGVPQPLLPLSAPLSLSKNMWD